MNQYYYPTEKKKPTLTVLLIVPITVGIIIGVLYLMSYIQKERPTPQPGTYHLVKIAIPMPVVGTLDKNDLNYSIHCETEDGYLTCAEAVYTK